MSDNMMPGNNYPASEPRWTPYLAAFCVKCGHHWVNCSCATSVTVLTGGLACPYCEVTLLDVDQVITEHADKCEGYDDD